MDAGGRTVAGRRAAVLAAVAVVVATMGTGVGPAAAAEVHVQAGGSIVAALQSAGPGDVVTVHEGDFPKLTLVDRSWDPPVVLRAMPGDDVRLSGAALTNVRGLRIEGFRVKGGHVSAFGGSELGIAGNTFDRVGVNALRAGVSDVLIEDNRFVGGSGFGITAYNNGGSGVEAQPHDITIRANEFTGMSNDAIQTGTADDVLIEDNNIHDLAGTSVHTDGIEVLGGDRYTIRRNRIVRTPGQGVILFEDHALFGDDADITDVVIENNLITRGGAAGVNLGATDGVRIVHNTMWGSAAASVHLAQANTELHIHNNVLVRIQRISGPPPTTEDHNRVGSGGSGPNDTTADPRFVNTVDYRLAADSPLIGAADPAFAAADDLDAAPRDAVPDIGAREVAAAAATGPTVLAAATRATPPAGASSLAVPLPPAASGGVLLVGVAVRAPSRSYTVRDATVGTTPLQPLIAVHQGSAVRVELWWAPAVPSGASSVTIRLDRAARAAAVAVAVGGVDATDPVGSLRRAWASSGSPVLAAPAALRDLIVDVAGIMPPAPITAPGATASWTAATTDPIAGNNVRVSLAVRPAPGSWVPLTRTVTSRQWAAAAAVLHAP